MDKRLDKIWLFFMNIFANTCHQKAERSFFISKYQFPICARCTGLMLGYILGVSLAFSGKQVNLLTNLVFILIMFIDWFLQYKKIKKSNNNRRLFTGFLCGLGIIGVCYTVLIHVL
ncbi:DUF2085 domain-containing protein [Clostridium sp.]|uniref:DUF2085 domain-containing protein n=1 Tax=Clostridium sp. TaxID=1506 RepID=UPI001D91D549|nr:DUF2085 domain-containing protein [Clostridium sp.]MBS5938979.1 DUF2085 domain-containing protein [Clostridium sp.]